jgi:hypothetical protein
LLARAHAVIERKRQGIHLGSIESRRSATELVLLGECGPVATA